MLMPSMMYVFSSEVEPPNETPYRSPWVPAAVPSTAPKVRPTGMRVVYSSVMVTPVLVEP